jgi:hypothetical protein
MTDVTTRRWPCQLSTRALDRIGGGFDRTEDILAVDGLAQYRSAVDNGQETTV